jgi:catechol 2,3-dioxygenase-like lactoylglutathione lyase family enzyme
MTGPQIEQDEIYPMPSFPMLQVSDLAASGRWYQDVLGFRHIFTMPGPGGEASLIHLRWRKYADPLLVSDRDTPKVSRGVGISLHFPVQEG